MTLVRAHAALTVLVLTFAITWAVWIPRALASHSLIEERWTLLLATRQEERKYRREAIVETLMQVVNASFGGIGNAATGHAPADR